MIFPLHFARGGISVFAEKRTRRGICRFSLVLVVGAFVAATMYLTGLHEPTDGEPTGLRARGEKSETALVV